jgi:sulfate adenylyltransferase (ADP) / ATP adenylyltransferase
LGVVLKEKLLLKPGTLWESIADRSDRALQCGALLSIPTEYEFIEQGGVRFLVRILSNLIRKEQAIKKLDEQTASGDRTFNPFLPYEDDLFVADVSDTHVCILNKFNVVDHHALVVTRAFEAQDTWLTLQDFTAMWTCLAEFDGLVFYNAGNTAGASQRHKHLQIIPLPFMPSEVQIPIVPLFASATFQDSIGTIPRLPFVHAFARLDGIAEKSPLQAAEATLACYHRLLQGINLSDTENDLSSNIQSGAYNLLATREWMLLVARSRESFESISVNALGFAGALLVRDRQQMQILKDYGPMNLLKQVAVPIED